jgi:hypothetical protein
LDDSDDPQAIEKALKRAIQLARERGAAVAIGHPYPATLDLLERIEPLLKKQNVTLVYASQLLLPITKITSLKNTSIEPKDDDTPFCPVPLESMPLKLETEVDLYDRLGIMPKQLFGY